MPNAVLHEILKASASVDVSPLHADPPKLRRSLSVCGRSSRTGDGICVELQPGIFAMHDDGLAYVKEAGWSDIFNGSGTDPVYKMAEGTADVPQAQLDSTIEAAEECPGECIFLEITE